MNGRVNILVVTVSTGTQCVGGSRELPSFRIDEIRHKPVLLRQSRDMIRHPAYTRTHMHTYAKDSSLAGNSPTQFRVHASLSTLAYYTPSRTCRQPRGTYYFLEQRNSKVEPEIEVTNSPTTLIQSSTRSDRVHATDL